MSSNDQFWPNRGKSEYHGGMGRLVLGLIEEANPFDEPDLAHQSDSVTRRLVRRIWLGPIGTKVEYHPANEHGHCDQ
ncbi:hypothetical protein H5410_030997 [Solanum commersonii]|uniref:Uncharacterized protein n=1 Tax=Solanum commersonii TaxID=4109 RepID=A0A9J5YFV7_SOLCO|nr:hypothetical protein H5410_030997 [Solanum commersonii]